MSWFRWATNTRKSLYTPLISDHHCSEDRSDKIVQFTPKQIRAITSNFDVKKLYSATRHASIYKCSLLDGRVVAVKRLVPEEIFDDKKHFMAHVDTLSSVHHPNLAGLLGYCYSKDYQILVSEFAENSNLYHHLYGGGSVLSWETRHKIAIGVARALIYLHNDCKREIVHRGIRPANILLNNEFEPKVADLGLRFLEERVLCCRFSKDDRVYVPPEYYFFGKTTAKSDVYSYGMLLLELLTGCVHLDRAQRINHLYTHCKKIKEIDSAALVDPKLGGMYNQNEVYRMAVTTCVCVGLEERPNMAEVLRALEGSPKV